MASGKAVIATREGGYLETVVQDKTGTFIDPTEEALREAIDKIGKTPEKYKNACIRRSRDFDTKVFIKAMKAEMREI